MAYTSYVHSRLWLQKVQNELLPCINTQHTVEKGKLVLVLNQKETLEIFVFVPERDI